MFRRSVSVASVALVLGFLAGCGSPSPYCQSVESAESTLNDFGAKHTDAAFAGYAKTMKSIAKKAPESSKPEWDALAKATQGVIETHADVGFRLDDMGDEKKREGLSEGDVEKINEAYTAFNDTQDQRKAIVADVKQTCDISLK